MRYASFGDVSTGTLRNVDLLDTFARELDFHVKRQPRSFKRAPFRKLIREAFTLARETEDATEDYRDGGASDLVAELMDALDTFAPPYAHFGAHEGDGASFGFYLGPWSLESFDGLRVDDTSEVPRDYRGEVLHVNDHGNVSLYVANGRGALREVWAVV
jgi:hypothetical protein